MLGYASKFCLINHKVIKSLEECKHELNRHGLNQWKKFSNYKLLIVYYQYKVTDKRNWFSECSNNVYRAMKLKFLNKMLNIQTVK